MKTSLNISISIAIGLVLFILSTALAHNAYEYNWRPPFTVTQNAMPSITLLLDTSNSMHRMAYAWLSEKTNEKNIYETYGTKFDPNYTYTRRDETGQEVTINGYYGYFDPEKRYIYDGTKFIIADDLAVLTETYSGSFMNWATMHRIDILRKVLTGGKRVGDTNDYEIVSTNDLTRKILYTVNSTTPVIPDFSGNATDGTEIVLVQRPNTTQLDIIKRQYKLDNKGNPVFDTEVTLIAGMNLRIETSEPAKGVLDSEKYVNNARFALFRFYTREGNSNTHKGAKLLENMQLGTQEHIQNIKNRINNEPLAGTAPLAESIWNVTAYLMQLNISTQDDRYAPQYEADSFTPDKNGTKDPYYIGDEAQYCAPQSIILLTPGESTFGDQIPISTRENNENKLIKEIIRPSATYINPATGETIAQPGKPYSIDTANFLRTTDLRSDLKGKQVAKLFVIQAFGKGSQLLKDTAMYGGFTDLNGDGTPLTVVYGKNKKDIAARNPQESEYMDITGKPHNYFAGADGEGLKTAISEAFDLAIRNLTSGTAAAVTTQTRSGEGAVYQALFFPPTANADVFAPAWAGQIHAFLVDRHGRLREDTPPQNQSLDEDDLIIEFVTTEETVIINRYKDINDDGVLTESEIIDSNISLKDVNFLWSTSDTMNSNVLNGTALTSKLPYDYLKRRYIVTFVDKDGDMIVDYSSDNILDPYDLTYANAGELQAFHMESEANPNSPSDFFSYLTLYENSFSPPPFNSAWYPELAKRQVDFIRGIDQSNTLSDGSTKDFVRNRTLDNGPTWPLGDIVSSSPLVIGPPAANYHILYGDKTYQEFYTQYKHRRQVAYVGANDGMLHAFNAGFYSRADRGFKTQLTSEKPYQLGTELWGYVPFNLLPHLRWLMNPNYGGDLHVAYMDLPPRAYDVRIFNDDSDHPNGWGTILVAGMRLGGGKIKVDVTKDGNDIRTMSSAYVIIDITNPEKPPRPLAEIKMPNMGFSTCIPSIMPMSTANSNSTTEPDNQWYLVFGSGPASNAHEADPTILQLNEIKSEQPGHLYVLDLKALVQGKKIRTYNSAFGFTDGSHFAATMADGSDNFISDPAAIDMDFNSKVFENQFKTDVVYYGTISGDSTHPSGAMHRLLTNNAYDDTWNTNSLLINVQQPISAAPTVVMDTDKTLWVYFGAGRFYDKGDIPQEGDNEQYMSFFGVKEPAWNSTHFDLSSPESASINNLFNSTQVYLTDYGECNGTYTKSCVEVLNATTNATIGDGSWDNLVDIVDAHDGWRYDFNQPWERVLGQSAALGGTVLFTSYTPETIVCNIEGNSRLYGLYYKTGTPYFDPIFGGEADIFTPFVGLGQGMAISPTLHISEDGATAFVQTSSGAIIPIELNIDIQPKTLFWRKNVQ